MTHKTKALLWRIASVIAACDAVLCLVAAVVSVLLSEPLGHTAGFFAAAYCFGDIAYQATRRAVDAMHAQAPDLEALLARLRQQYAEMQADVGGTLLSPFQRAAETLATALKEKT